MSEVFDYAVVRVVPRVEREEFVNVGVIVACPTAEFLGCKVATDLTRVQALTPSLDLDIVARHIEALRLVCEGDATGGAIATLSSRERFHWLTHPRSTVLQTSAVHSGQTDDPNRTLRELFAALVL